MFERYVAIGDSFTEGVGDELADGRVRGWADFVALGLALAAADRVEGGQGETTYADDAPPAEVRYANLAIRGKKLTPILDEQLEAALALGPDLVSLNGGGNDIMRPRVSIAEVSDRLHAAADRVVEHGAHLLLLSGANPSEHLPMGALVEQRGERLAAEVRARLPREGVTFVDNWADHTLRDGRYWSADKLHLNAFGHARVAANVLGAFGVPVPESWRIAAVAEAPAGPPSRRNAAYYREYVLPWIGRRLTGRSSGDNRSAKLPTLEPVVVVEPTGL